MSSSRRFISSSQVEEARGGVSTTVASAGALPLRTSPLGQAGGVANSTVVVTRGSVATGDGQMRGLGLEMVPVVPETAARIAPGAVAEFRDRRRRRRVGVPEAYSIASVRVLAQQAGPTEGNVVNISETGMLVDLDNLIAAGSAISIEFCVTGLGRLRNDQWPTFAVAAEVVRHENVDDFPGGPYRTAVRFVRMSTMVQAQIARYVVAHQ